MHYAKWGTATSDYSVRSVLEISTHYIELFSGQRMACANQGLINELSSSERTLMQHGLDMGSYGIDRNSVATPLASNTALHGNARLGMYLSKHRVALSVLSARSVSIAFAE